MRDAIALVPGFLGFDHLGHWTYWADRFLAGLRSQLEAQRPDRSPIPVVPVPSFPIGSLAARQTSLLDSLKRLDAAHAGPRYRWHLVGHSTGGLDAAFLARTQRLVDSEDGTVFSDEPLPPESPNLGSITTLSTPHYGTCLALSPIAELKAHHISIAAVKELVRLSADVFARGPGELAPRIEFALGSLLEGSTIQFVHSLLTNDKLARDLHPSVAGPLTQAENRRLDVPIFSVATVAPQPPDNHPDKLFRDLWRLTQLEVAEAEPAPSLRWPPAKVIASAAAAVPKAISARDNDGVVNTDRQVDVGAPNATFAGAVFGDHGDVLGLYRRVDPLDQKPIEPGLLTSGAEFGDDEFFALLALVAKGIASRIL